MYKCGMSKSTLSSQDRSFLELLSKAISTNPFSEERTMIDARLAGTSYDEMQASDRQVALFLPRIAERLEKLAEKGFHKIQSLSGTDRLHIEYAWLFLVYHQHLNAFDALIQEQLQRGAASCKAPFSNKVLADLTSHGFSETESLYYFAIFYQLRRAFYFIEKGLIGKSPSMRSLRRSLWNNVFTYDIRLYYENLINRMEDFSTLLLGRTGTGKGTAAAAIGRSGFIPFDKKRNAFAESFTKTFLSINLSQYPESLIESELFGHKKGSFTGAVEDHGGIFSQSNKHGALFLDEIGDVSTPVQIKLLKVLQERVFSPVGSHEQKRFEGRVIAATNRDLADLRSGEQFRDDFFYRLSSDIITVPTLSQRISENPSERADLVAITVERILGKKSPHIEALITETLSKVLPDQYAWPGNVRELEQTVRRILLTGTCTINRSSTGASTALGTLRDGIEKGSLDFRQLASAYVKLLYERLGTFEAVARRTRLDRRTVKKYLNETV